MYLCLAASQKTEECYTLTKNVAKYIFCNIATCTILVCLCLDARQANTNHLLLRLLLLYVWNRPLHQLCHIDLSNLGIAQSLDENDADLSLFLAHHMARISKHQKNEDSLLLLWILKHDHHSEDSKLPALETAYPLETTII